MSKYILEDYKRSQDDFSIFFKEDQNATYAERDFSIFFPSSYVKKDLASITSVIEVICILMVVDEVSKKYKTLSIPVKQKFSPNETQKVTLNDVPYYKMNFKKGQIVTPNNNCVKTADFLFTVFETFYLRGKVPIFLSYEDLGNLLDKTKKYCGSSIGENLIAIHIIVAVMTRFKDDEDKLYKEVLKTLEDLKTKKPSFKGLSDIFYGIDNTVSSLIGGYLIDGMTGSIVKPETTSTKIADILKA